MNDVLSQKNWESFVGTLREVDHESLFKLNCEAVYEHLKALDSESIVKVGFSSSHTLDPLQKWVSVCAARYGLKVIDYLSDYNQYFQEVINPASELLKFEPDVLYLELSLREIAPEIHYELSSLSDEAKHTAKARVIDWIDEWIQNASKNTKALLLIANFPRPKQTALGLADAKEAESVSAFYFALNEALRQRSIQNGRLHIVDADHLAAVHGLDAVFSEKYYHLAKIPWTHGFQRRMARHLAVYLHAACFSRKKCLVLDLDNTLWGGVLGEDGVSKLLIGHGDPVSEAFLTFQYAIRAIKERGVLLAICSKNNPQDVDCAFDELKMPLKKDDFVVIHAGWDSKDKGLRAIAHELSIALDSLVFVDDSAVECEMIRNFLPEVSVVHLPEDPSEYADLLLSRLEFQQLQLGREDKLKTSFYHEEKARTETKANFKDLSEFYKSLETQVFVRLAGGGDLPRVHQLFSNTASFLP